MLYKRKRKWWWVKFKSKGKTVRLPCGTTDRRAAIVEAARLRAQHNPDAPRRAVAGCAMSQLAAADMHRAELEGSTSEWQESLGYYWRQILGHFGPKHDAGKLTYDAIQEYAYARRKAGAKGQTVRRELQAIKRSLGIARRRGWLTVTLQDWPKVKGDPKNKRQAGKLHDIEVISRWLRELTDEARDHVVFAMLTGLRAKELTRVDASWVRPSEDGCACPAWLVVPAEAAKTRTERVIALPHLALEILGRRGRFGSASHRRTREAACRRIGYDQVITLRDLRHTFASVGERSDRKATQDALGHTTERMTMGYLHSDPARIAAVGAAVEAALGGTLEGAHSKVESDVSTGGRRGFRTPGIQLVRLESKRNRAISHDSGAHFEHDESPACVSEGAHEGAHDSACNSGGER